MSPLCWRAEKQCLAIFILSTSIFRILRLLRGLLDRASIFWEDSTNMEMASLELDIYDANFAILIKEISCILLVLEGDEGGQNGMQTVIKRSALLFNLSNLRIHPSSFN